MHLDRVCVCRYSVGENTRIKHFDDYYVGQEGPEFLVYSVYMCLTTFIFPHWWLGGGFVSRGGRGQACGGLNAGVYVCPSG